MSPEETIRMIRLIKKIAKQRAMVVIEHNMKLVWSISSVITVFHQGQVIATGPPSQIEKNAEVRKAYLGGDAE